MQISVKHLNDYPLIDMSFYEGDQAFYADSNCYYTENSNFHKTSNNIHEHVMKQLLHAKQFAQKILGQRVGYTGMEYNSPNGAYASTRHLIDDKTTQTNENINAAKWVSLVHIRMLDRVINSKTYPIRLITEVALLVIAGIFISPEIFIGAAIVYVAWKCLQRTQKIQANKKDAAWILKAVKVFEKGKFNQDDSYKNKNIKFEKTALWTRSNFMTIDPPKIIETK